jgi:zinc protease
MRRSALLLALLLCTGPSIRVQPLAAPDDVLPFRATERTLPNGLKVIVIPTGFPNLVSVQIPVQTGSRNEVEPGKSGYAHFFEHLMFRGTKETPPSKFNEIMTRAGARNNATTSDDRTLYFATFAKEHLNEVLGTYADMFQHLDFPEADFKTEARAVLGEYNKNSAEPLQKLIEVQRETFYQAHTYKHTTMGFVADIENMPNEYQYSKVFFQRWYRPEYTTVIVAGDVVPDQVMPMVEKHWGGWKSGTSSTPPPVPKEPPPAGPKYVHVPWATETLPYVTVAFPNPAFVETAKDPPALDLVATLYFGQTSELYKRLVVSEQKVDSLGVSNPDHVDSSLFTVIARVKNPADAVYVRDQILATIAAARTGAVPAQRLADAKSFVKYGFSRTLDSTESIASVVAAYAAFRRSYDTVNAAYRTIDSLQPADLQAAAQKYFTDAGMIVTTLSKAPLAPEIAKLPKLADVKPGIAFPSPGSTPRAEPPPLQTPAPGAPLVNALTLPSALPQIDVKILFKAGSAHDPAGKEGLAALTAAMIARGGSRTLSIDQIDAVLYPIAASFGSRVDKEMTVFTGIVHRDQAARFLSAVLPQLLDPGFRDDDFRRLKAAQLNALTQDLRSNNEEELGKEQLQLEIFRGTPYGHVALGTVAGLNAITLDDVRQFAKANYTKANLLLGIHGHAQDGIAQTIRAALAKLPDGPAAPAPAVEPRRLAGPEVSIIEKDTRATAISLGFPIAVKRGDPDFPALYLARTWLGEHRASSGRLYQRIREVRGMNYGDYAYIEAFPRGMFQFFPDPNLARRRQIFEIWIRPVVPVNAHMALRIALYELDTMVRNGINKTDFETTRDYLMNNVYVMTARQDQQLGYALDSQFYGIAEFTEYMRKALQSLTLDQVNAAIKRHLAAPGMSIVVVTKDAAGLKQALAADAFSPIKYDGEKDRALLDEDKIIGAMKLNIPAGKITITPIEQVFGK